jgi:hypothetical protein
VERRARNDGGSRVGGEPRILDHDEFLENQVSRAYPEDLISGATLAAQRIYEAVVGKREPFGQVGWRRLAEALASHG